jgi:hypothetical protein
MVESLGTPGLKTRAYFSTYHVSSAKHFAELAEKIEQNHSGDDYFNHELRAYVTSSVISAVAFLESAINELYDDIAELHQNERKQQEQPGAKFRGHRGFVKDLPVGVREKFNNAWTDTKRKPRPLERESILKKYVEALSCAGATPFDKGGAPYQDANSKCSTKPSAD